VSNDDVHATGDVLIAQITSQHKADCLNFALADADLTVPLPKQSFVRLHKLFVLEETLIEKKVSSVLPQSYKKLSKAICKIIQ
jgi:mRNA interferase MazF